MPIDKDKQCQLDPKTEDAFRHKGYTVETLLGAGSYGEVYKGTRIDTGQRCAVKMMDLSKMSDRFKRRFLPRELTSLMEIKHENIVRVWDIFRSNKKIYIFMEFASNGDLGEVLKKSGSLDEAQARPWFTQMASALNYLHNEHFTAHRDIKIDNILLDDNWNAKLTDFGFAVESADTDGNVTLRKTFCGTQPYYSPQIAKKMPYDPFKTDVWAMGVVLYAMTHNKFPFHFRDVKMMIKEQYDLNYKTKRIDRRVSKDLKDLLLAMFEPEESARIDFGEVVKHSWVCLE